MAQQYQSCQQSAVYADGALLYYTCTDTYYAVGETIVPSQPTISRQGLSSPLDPSDRNNGFSPHQVHMQQSLALTAASISVLSAAISLYWFIRMKRNFRHKLILLLIISQMLKSLVYLLYPVVSFVHGPIKDSSSFCQFTGFISVVSIEASDFMILLIATHTILYIIRPKGSTRGTGLYPFRYIAYVCWALFSLLMASIAFANPKHAYVTQGTFCYLPPRPFWYRLALAWIPRYLILSTILCVYVAVFIYVRSTVNRFDHSSVMSYEIPSGGSPIISALSVSSRRGSRTGDLPMRPLPSSQMAPRANGMVNISTTQGQSRVMELQAAQAARKPSQASDGASDCPEPTWERYSFGHLTPLPNVSHEEELGPTRLTDGQYPRRVLTIIEALQERRISWTPQFQSKKDTPPPDTQVQLMAPGRPTLPALDSFAMPRGNVSNSEVVRGCQNANLRRRHQIIKRQIRFLFVYPLVYLLTWIVPFIGHCFQYNDRYAEHPFFPLSCASTTIVALQCAIDCWLFGYREKPWQQMNSGSVTFWQSFLFWRHLKRSNGTTMPTVERKSTIRIKPKNWWSEEEMLRETSFRMGSEDPMVGVGARSMAAGLRRDVRTHTNGGWA